MATLTGEVLGERTVLSFPRGEENPNGDHVRQLHTGRTDHATGYQTQLRFNLYPNLEHARHINHPPRPPPVVIERLPPQHISTHDKLEMAALLARRDFRNGRIPSEFLSTEQSGSSSSEEDEAGEVGRQVVSLQPKPEPKPVQVIETVPPSIPQTESLPNIKSNESNIDKMASEVVSLRRQLRRQVSRLRDAVHDKKTSKISFEDEDDVERELRREDGRSLRNMQSLYTLQQQVQKLRLELDKHQNVSTTVKGTKKSLAMKQLAATHRSAIRLLHSFAGMPGRPVVYRQLSKMMQQLTLCCCQLGLDGAQLLELNDQMKALENEIVELNKNEEDLTTVTRLRQVQPAKKLTRKPAKAPLSQGLSNFISGQANVRTGHFRAQTFSSKMRRKTPPAQPNPKQLTPSRRRKHGKGPPKFTSIPSLIQLRPLPARRPVNPSGARQSTVPTYKKQKSKKRKRLAKKQHSTQSHSDMHKDGEKDEEVLPFQSNDRDEKDSPNISDENSVSDSESSTEDVVSLVNDAVMKHQLLSASTPMPAAPPKPLSHGYHDKTGDDSIPRDLEMLQSLQEMLVKISHIEEQKMRIQQRWNQLTFRDASVKQVVRTPSPLPRSDTTLSVSPSVLKSVSHYRDRFHHHLKLKGAITGQDWESSKLIEELSEEILDEIVDSTVNEVDQLCEQYAHNIFASEFAVPNANI